MRILCTTILCLLLATSAMAMSHESKTGMMTGDYAAHFPDMDTSGDGLVDMEEFDAYFPDNSENERAFELIDQDDSGDIDHDEWHEFKSAHGYGHKEGEGHGHDEAKDKAKDMMDDAGSTY
jgi:Ca2+-binding EF-hand superfamily protein